MLEKSYPLQNEKPCLVTPPNETYNDKEFPTVITTTAGVYVQSGERIRIIKAKAQIKLK